MSWGIYVATIGNSVAIIVLALAVMGVASR